MESYNMQESDNSWINIADIMSALMMIFMFISIAFLFQILNEKEIYKVELNKALHKEFDKDLHNWQAVITEDNIMRFDSPFQTGSAKIPENFEKILEDFFPRYIKVLTHNKFKKEIEEVRVEGHTSYGWGSIEDKKLIYLNNMDLSQQRASSVLAYCYSLENPFINQNRKWLEENLRANGISFSKPLFMGKSQGIVDSDRSKRVEFKVLTKEHKKS
jgi:outer membrane protein OmpA-like peptidoglycan-associated protein